MTLCSCPSLTCLLSLSLELCSIFIYDIINAKIYTLNKEARCITSINAVGFSFSAIGRGLLPVLWSVKAIVV